MNRRKFLIGAAALAAAQTVLDKLVKIYKPPVEGSWVIGYDPAVKDKGMLLYARVHDEQIYVTGFEEDFNTDALIERWRERNKELVEFWRPIWGTKGL